MVVEATKAGFWIVGIWKAFGDNTAPSGFFSFFAGTVTIPVEPCLLIGKSGFNFGFNCIEAQVTAELFAYLPISLGHTGNGMENGTHRIEKHSLNGMKGHKLPDYSEL
jgi:hypothetical protein